MTLEEAIEYTLSCGKGASILSKLFSASKKPLATDIDVARNALLPEEDVLFSISTLTKVGSTGGSHYHRSPYPCLPRRILSINLHRNAD